MAVKAPMAVVPFDSLQYLCFRAEYRNMVALATARFRGDRRVGEIYTMVPTGASLAAASATQRSALSSVLQDLSTGAAAYRTESERVEEIARHVQSRMPTSTKTATEDEVTAMKKQVTAQAKQVSAQAKTVKRLTDSIHQLQKEAKRLRTRSPGGAAGASGASEDHSGARKEESAKTERPPKKRSRSDEDERRSAARAALRLKAEDEEQLDSITPSDFFRIGIQMARIYKEVQDLGVDGLEAAEAKCLNGILFYPPDKCPNKKCKGVKHGADGLLSNENRQHVFLNLLDSA